MDLAVIPANVPVRMTADGRYAMWVNSQEASRGPARSEPPLLYWDEVDLAPLLRPGRNAVSVLVRHYGWAAPWWLHRCRSRFWVRAVS